MLFKLYSGHLLREQMGKQFVIDSHLKTFLILLDLEETAIDDE